MIYQDGTFNPAHWEPVVVNDVGGSASAVQSLAAGDPAPSRTTALSSAALDNRASVVLASINPLFTYDPSVSGGIAQLDFSYSLAFLSSSNVNSPHTGGYRPVLRQNGLVYSLLRPNHFTASTSWTPFSVSSTNAADWAVFSMPNLNPDFSATGSVIEFGYRAGQPSAVPEPGAWLLVVSGLGLFEVCRRRMPASRD